MTSSFIILQIKRIRINVWKYFKRLLVKLFESIKFIMQKRESNHSTVLSSTPHRTDDPPPQPPQHPPPPPSIITDAFETALRKRQPVYIEICHNLAAAPMPTHNPAPMIIEPGPVFNAKSLRQSANAIIDKFNAAKNPVLMFGARALASARQVDGINDRQLLLQQLPRRPGVGSSFNRVGRDC